MALSGLEIFKLLPKTNCGECKNPTCLAFAMKLANGQVSLDECPHVSGEAKAVLEEASSPPIAKIVIGTGDGAVEVGGETVLFRHEKRFVNRTAVAVLVSDASPDEEIDAELARANACTWERVGERLGLSVVAVRSDSGDVDRFASVVSAVAEKTGLALMLITTDPAEMRQAVEIVGQRRPLLYGATEEHLEEFIRIATDADCPLCLVADGLERTAALSERAAGLGISDLVLDPGTRTPAETLAALVAMRREALSSKFRPFGYPVVAFPCDESPEDPLFEAALASAYIAKYASIVVTSNAQVWMQYPLQVEIQNIFTDPQKPMAVDSMFYRIGNPGPDSPVLVTTNFSLTYFIVSGEIESSKVDAWLGIVDAEGQSVLTAWAAGKFVPDTIARFINRSGIAGEVEHRKLMIPGYVTQIAEELAEELPDWEILVAPREAADLPAYLREWRQ